MPEIGSTPESYADQKTRLLKDFDKAVKKHYRRVLASHYGSDLADTVLKETRHEYDTLISEIPDIGGKKNTREMHLVRSAWVLALYRTLRSHGKTTEEVGRLSYELAEAQLASTPRWLLQLLGRWWCTRYSLNNKRKDALESQKRRYPNNWVLTFVEGDGKEFDYGTDITECAVCKFYHAQGADEFAPYICRTDFPLGQALGLGIVRTTTIAEGGKVCDFRYKHGRETRHVWA